jgi:8-amino-7-oxononanoate synthase
MNKKYAAYTESPLRSLMAMTPINGAFILHEDQKLLTFCCFDHLALTDNPTVKKNAIKYVLQHGIYPFSQVADFYLTCQQDLEKKLSDLLRRESALFFSSRSEANFTTLSAIGHTGATIFIDEKCHPSLMTGAEASKARVVRYSNLEQLERLLDRAADKIIVTESVFSHDGSITDLPQLTEIADHFQALLYVDDSHAFGISGIDGMGLCAHLPEVDIISGSFGKACGAYGGYIACKQTIRDYLIKKNALLSPPIIGAIEASLDLIPQMEGERKQLEQRSHWLKQTLREMGFTLPKFNTPLVSIEMKSEDECERLKSYLLQEQILVNTENNRIKLALNVCHMPDHLTRLTDAIKSWLLAGISLVN